MKYIIFFAFRSHVVCHQALASGAAAPPAQETSKKSKKNGKKSPDSASASSSNTKVNGDVREKSKSNGDSRDKELSILRKENEELRVNRFFSFLNKKHFVVAFNQFEAVIALANAPSTFS